MSITITFRHMESTESIRNYAEEKIGKLQRFLRQPLTARVTLSVEKHEHVVETRISSGSERFEAKQSGAAMYAVIDNVIDKLERQISGAKGMHESKRRRSGEIAIDPAIVELEAV